MKRIWIMGLSAVFAAAAADAQVARRPFLPAVLQLELAERARDACAAGGFDVGVAIADASGLVRTQVSGDTAGSVAIETARRKAMSAVLVGFPTAKLGDAVREAPAYADMLRSLHPDMIFIGGGVPIRIDGQLVGAIGVGGASGGAADEACATKALTALADKLK
ncbi:heme-binding protein [Sphingomonas sp. RB3P16]|uniref:GlcG/HbpS family heme-binding protein n=1 Tax=Parasphingomonas frigoris TaxID=3096163 RepID=UPI002FCB7068